MADTSELVRQAILTSIPNPPAEFDKVKPQYVYVPSGHLKALSPDAMLVEGIRGAGKSFWWFALQNQDVRKVVLRGSVTVTEGFGQNSSLKYPDRDELALLLRENVAPRLIWRTVLLRQINEAIHFLPVEASSWLGWTKAISENPSVAAAAMREYDDLLTRTGRSHMVLFDALDRTADSNEARASLLAGLLQLVLELRSFRSIRAKVFARPDMLQSPVVKGFPDASKVFASAANLTWKTQDLYGLLFQYAGNADSREASAAFRQLAEGSDVNFTGGVWQVPDTLRSEGTLQQKLFERIAGPFMGTNARRGRTYAWVPNHLADALDAVSPRSFLAAIRKAADEPPKHEFALHWDGLQEGVRYASKIRTDEIREDISWAHDAMSDLRDVVVPCQKAQLFSGWKASSSVGRGGSETAQPENYESRLEALRLAGILKLLPGDRINIPDVYRLGFGLRRKGGFAPRRS
jgi:hypothetical protein